MPYVKTVSTLSCFAIALTLSASKAEAQHHSRSGSRHRSTTYRYVYRPYYPPFGYGGYGYYDYAFGPGWYGYGYGYPYAGPVVYASADAGRASLRVLVEPVETEVYVDGYYAGIVDDYDGYFQRLYLRPGEHTIELYLDGHSSIRKTLYFSPGATYKLRHEMQSLAAGETVSKRPEPPELENEPEPEPEPELENDFGVLGVNVQPADSELVIDGEPWTTSERWEQTLVHLPVGKHDVEIRKDGYRSFQTTIEIRPGRRTDLNVRLPKGARDERDLPMGRARNLTAGNGVHR